MKATVSYLYGQVLPNTYANSGASLDLCRSLADRGHVVTLYYVGSSKNEGKIRSAYDLSLSVKCVALRTIPGPLQQFYWVLQAIFSDSKAVLITRMAPAAILSCLLRRKCILELHQNIELTGRWKFWRSLVCLLPKKQMAVTVQTQALGDQLDPQVKTKVRSVTVVPSAAPDFLGIKTKPKYDAGYVGSLMPGKGIEIVKTIAELVPEAKIVVFGDPTSNPEAVAALQNASNVTLAGFVPRSEIKDALTTFRVGLAPYSASGFGGAKGPFVMADALSSLKVVEYMSASRAIIASRIPAVEAVVEHGKHAILCAPENSEEWAGALRRLLSDHAFCDDLAKNARDHFLGKFSFSKRAEVFSKIIQNLAGAHSFEEA